MATTNNTKTPETALPDDGGKRASGSPGAGYVALIEWIRGLEETDLTTRVYAIHTTDANAPEEEFLTFSRPKVLPSKIDGYEKADGSIVPFNPAA